MRLLAQSLAPAIDLVYPPRCPICGDGIDRQDGLCLDCWRGLVLLREPSCAVCQRPMPDGEIGSGHLCALCLSEPPLHSGIYAATLYNDASRKLVLAFKHGRRIALARLMARLMQARLPLLPEDTLLVPVPLHRGRLWRRGYNQAALLAQEIGRLTAQPVAVDALVRTRATPSLGGLGRKARERALVGAIALGPRWRTAVQGRKILLVDDVVTSGATTDRCVGVLLKSGASEVMIASFARVLSEAENDGRMPENETPGIR